MAYSSAITICGGQDIYMTSNNWVSFIPLVLSAIIFLMIVLNNKGIRTWIAAIMTLFGTLFIVLSHQLLLSPAFYNVGGVGMILAIWVNGNLRAFVSQLTFMFQTDKKENDKKQITYLINQK